MADNIVTAIFTIWFFFSIALCIFCIGALVIRWRKPPRAIKFCQPGSTYFDGRKS
jgi:hypothetical protein